ncbi:hypothetical protein Harman_24050 [Haloarcula mannanilytica]|uniref:ISXO2-like transposase domain-containing protein n=1 Tax=Haloarcula mannanilytica TaxID=2509225 RepID=A0A4C2EM72_9EURY|nr:hypothetical protein Harman_24050 [Haloarcula mannanilytica]
MEFYKTGTVFEYSSIPLRKWYLAVYTYIRLNTSIRQLDAELAVTYKTVYRRVQRFLRTLDAPRLQLEGPVEIDELYVKAGKKGRERDRPSRSRGLSTRGRGTYHEDKPPVFVLADRGTGETYVHPSKAADESTIRLLLGTRQQESLTVYTDGFRAYESLDSDDAFDRQYVVHGEGEYADGDVHVNTCESHASPARRWLSPIGVFPKTSSRRISEGFSYASASAANPVRKHSKSSWKLRYEATNNRLSKSEGGW